MSFTIDSPERSFEQRRVDDYAVGDAETLVQTMTAAPISFRDENASFEQQRAMFYQLDDRRAKQIIHTSTIVAASRKSEPSSSASASASSSSSRWSSFSMSNVPCDVASPVSRRRFAVIRFKRRTDPDWVHVQVPLDEETLHVIDRD